MARFAVSGCERFGWGRGGDAGAVLVAAQGVDVAELPTGTVTFMFTDLEGSTRPWEEQPAAMQDSLARHDAILHEAIASHRGVVFSEMGDGMAAAFASATDAVAAGVEAQLGLERCAWDETGPLRARMGLHASSAELRSDGQYVSQPLNRCARLMGVAHGGQLVVSETVESLVRGTLPRISGCWTLVHTDCVIWRVRSACSRSRTRSCSESFRRCAHWTSFRGTCPCR